MRIQMITRLAGPVGVLEPGSVVDVPIEMAKQLVDGGYAEYIEEASTPVPSASGGAEVEEAAVKPPEQAVKRRKSGGGTARRGRI